jgi:hypothetical protein
MYYGSGLDDFAGLSEIGTFANLGLTAAQRQQREAARLAAAIARSDAAAKRAADKAAAQAARVAAQQAAQQKREAARAAAAIARSNAAAAKAASKTTVVGYDASSAGYASPQTEVCKFGADPNTGGCYPTRAAANRAQKLAAKQGASAYSSAGAGAPTGLTPAQQRKLTNLQNRLQKLLARPKQTAALQRQEQNLAAQIQAMGGSVPDLSAAGAGLDYSAGAGAGIDPNTGLPFGAPGQPTLPPYGGDQINAPDMSQMTPQPTYPMTPSPAPAPGYPDYSQMAPMSMGPAPGGGGFAPMDSTQAGSPMGIDPTTGLPVGQQPPQPDQTPAAMSTTADAGSNPLGLSNTTMLLILGGAAVLWYVLSKKKKGK